MEKHNYIWVEPPRLNHTVHLFGRVNGLNPIQLTRGKKLTKFGKIGFSGF